MQHDDRTRPQPEEATAFIAFDASDLTLPGGAHWPSRDLDVPRSYTQIAVQVAVPPPPPSPIGPPPGSLADSLAQSSSKLAIAALVSRITGFGWKVALALIIGTGVVNDSFNIANTLPNMVFELLLGGVLSSVVIPLLVRSHDDPDGGEAYAQRLITMALVLLALGTACAVAAAPLFTAVYVDSSSPDANPALTTALGYLVLPQILFYGLFALFSAILNAKNVFGPPAWAPVLNNIVVLISLAGFYLVPGEISLDPVRMGDPKLLVLGLGVTLGIVVQALVLIPPLLRSGFRFRWRWGLDPRLKEFGGLAAWILGYVAVSQLGLVVNTHVLTSGTSGGVTAYTYAWLLFQLPYGVIGVSLLTAFMPRMSRAAADGDTQKLVGDLSYAARLSTVLLMPCSAVLAVIGTPIGIAIFAWGKGTLADADRLGQTLAISALGLLPYAMVLLQLRVFYAMKDARTPTLIMMVMTAVKIPLLLLCQDLLDREHVVLGAMLVNGATFVVGAVIGQVWLWVRLGHLRSRRALRVILVTAAVSGLGAAAALLAGLVVPDSLGPVWQALVRLPLEGIVGAGVAFGLLAALKIAEFDPITRRIAGLRRA
ncbi:murein biosynthesis integral membrane protein MurJ [Amycolatopsis sp. H20-H5]|uniref:murein biosynthesis integral membrane protein MurJ n=1 Tax=Amycolatopsis sp. H20-H5 TaxID=3046309 RepID=UPI002DB94892|nr:murein biosynthesis integral membrane protein MurJ [Amycolatopsis sp. H20-H5]MEC3976797.1 murein biosynthesis integral membrane protein MurJ [Amycolatopsis sp. H20-H5]